MAQNLAAGHPHPLASAGVVRRYLPGVSHRHALDRVLDRQPVHQQPAAPILAHQFPRSICRPHPRDHRAHRPAGGAGDRDGHYPRVPLCLFHGEGGDSTGAQCAFRGRPPSSVGQLLGPRLRLDSHPHQRRDARLGYGASWARCAKHRLHQPGHVGRIFVPLVAFYDPAHLRRPRASTGLIHRSLGRPRCSEPADLS